ncbi:very-long-chain 3-oxoacyl-CoA reductase-like protein At1g24470 [Euphorbia lathyris]|uniref:very-long-chain 3-oxoacyl-CoA reductase-like protein At1g24470 n=1 Tax=Euphorbia lathyris TaxID=212925 RepID=UPI00331442EF
MIFLSISFLGFLSFLTSSFTLLNWLFKTFLRPPKNLNQTYGSWALITGATDGIGKAFAHQLAKQGLNLVLLGRNSTKLTNVKNEIESESPNSEIRTLICDFSSGDGIEIERRIKEGVEGLDLGVLINNAGITYPQASFFHEIDEEAWMEIVRVNLEGTTRVTRAVLDGMIRRKRGAIVNIGSGSAIVVPSHPLFTVYAATKAYIDQLSRCLYVEYKSYGIDVQCQVPLYVATKMTSRVARIEKTSMFVPSAIEYAKAAIYHIGYEERCTPYWPHSLQWFFASLVPPSFLDSWRLSIGISRKLST